MGDLIVFLAPVVTVGLPAVAGFLRARRRGPAQVVSAVELKSGDRVDVSGSSNAELRSQIEVVLEAAPPLATTPDNVRKSHWHRKLIAGLNVKITPLQVFYGIVILTGIAAKEIWGYDQKYGKPGIRLADMTGALLVAPIVYTAVQPHIAPLHDSLTLVGIGIAFQSGFFWQSVFAAAEDPTRSH